MGLPRLGSVLCLLAALTCRIVADDSAMGISQNDSDDDRCCLSNTAETPIAKAKRKPKRMAFMIGAQKSGQSSDDAMVTNTVYNETV